MLLIDKMIVGGVRFVLDKLTVAVEQELNDDTSLREELLAAQMRVELGEMTQAEFSALEDEVLARIREIRERTGRGGGPIEMGGGASDAEGQGSLAAADIASIDASFVADDFYGDEPAAQATVDVPAEVAPPAAASASASARKPKRKSTSKSAGGSRSKTAGKRTRKPGRPAAKKKAAPRRRGR